MVKGTNIQQVLRMKEGIDESSYAKSSYLQKQVLLLAKPTREKAIRELYCKEQPTTLCIADLGCSSSESNTLTVVAELIEAVESARRELGTGSQVYQIYLNDLPWNDFNTIFRSLPSFTDKLKQDFGYDFGHCFVNGVPGSFYERLFPSDHLHFVHSSYSLHWLSKVPEGIADNKRNIYTATTSPPNVVKAYYLQFENDFTTFLKCRSEEIVTNGRMVLTLLGRKRNQHFDDEHNCCDYMWKLLAIVLNDMVYEGLIEEEKLNTFNIPMYSPTTKELSNLVEKEGSFFLNEVHVFEVSWEATEYYMNTYNQVFEISDYAKCMRSVAEPLLTSHFGETIVDDVFERYKGIIRVSMDKLKNVYINVTISLTRNTH